MQKTMRDYSNLEEYLPDVTVSNGEEFPAEWEKTKEEDQALTARVLSRFKG